MNECCLKCGTPLPPSANTGRPRVYCSAGCRRAAAMEIKRLNDQLSKLEGQATHARLGWSVLGPGEGDLIAAEIVRIEKRLRDLLEAVAE